MTAGGDDLVLEELTGAAQAWLGRCVAAVAAGPDATAVLLEPGPETLVLARQSLARWKNIESDDQLLEEETDDPGEVADGRRVSADLSAARAIAVLAGALTGIVDVEQGARVFLDHAEAAGLRSAGTQLLPAGTPLTGHTAPLRDLILHLLGLGGRAGRGYAIMAALELAGLRPPTVRCTRIRVLFVNHLGVGEVGTLWLRQLRDGPSGLHPDPARMGFLHADTVFVDSVRHAWSISRLADTDACVLWSVTLDGNAPANDIDGASMTAAFAVALDDLAPRHRLLRPLRPRRLDPMCAITAGLTGATLTPVHGYRAKLAAAQQHSLRVIVASDAHATAREQAPQEYGDHIHDAHDVTEAVARARTRFNPAPWTVTVVAMLTVLVTVLSITHVIGQRLDDVAARVESTSRLYANIARTSAAADPALAQQIALAAYRLAPTPDARSALLETSAGAPLRITPATGFGPVSLDDAPRLAATPDGRFLAVGGHDGLVHLVSVADGAIRRLPPIRTDSGTIRALALSADRRWLVVAGDRESALWDLAATPRRAATLPADRRPPWSVAISPDTRMIALGTRDGHIFTWTRTDTDTDSLIPAFPTLTVAAGQRTSVALSDRALAAAVPSALTGTWTTTLRTWDTTTLDPAPVTDLRVERPDGAQARTLQFDTAGTVLALGLNPGAILRWRLTPTATMDPLPGLDRPGADFLDISLDGDARRAAIVGADSTVRVVDLDTGATTTTVRVATPARALITGAALLTSSLDRSIQLHRPWAALTPTTPLTLYRFPHRHTPPPGLDVPALPLPRAGLAAPEPTTGDPEGFIDVVATSPDNRRAATRTAHAIQLWDTTDPTLARPLGPPLPSAGVDVAAIVFASDNTLAIGRGLTSTVELWDATGPGEPVQRATLRFGRGYPTSLAYSPDGHTLAVGSYLTGVVRVYDLRTSSSAPPSIDLPPIDARGETMTLALNPEAILAVGVRAGLHVYDTTARPAAREIALPGGGLDAVNAVAFDDSGTRLAASTTTSLHLWDLTDPDHPSSYATLARAPIHWKPAMLSFDSTGQTLTESATDATLRHWNTDAQTLASRICANGATPITPDEWRRALPGTTPVDTCPP